MSTLDMCMTFFGWNIYRVNTISFTYDHRTLRTELPVRSAVLKQGTGGLVVRWVTTSESPLLYVFDFFAALSIRRCGAFLFVVE